MATEKDLERVIERVIDAKLTEIADRTVDRLLSREDAVIGRNYASIFRSPARLDELASPHENDYPVVLKRIEDGVN